MIVPIVLIYTVLACLSAIMAVNMEFEDYEVVFIAFAWPVGYLYIVLITLKIFVVNFWTLAKMFFNGMVSVTKKMIKINVKF